MMKKRAHRNREKLKVLVEFYVQKAQNFAPSRNSAIVYITWKRGTKKSQGDTKSVIVKNGEAEWNEKIQFESKLFIDAISGRADEKKLSLYIFERGGKKLAKASVNLATYYENGKGVENATIPFTLEEKEKDRGKLGALSIIANFVYKPLKYNDKSLTKVGNRSTSKDPRLVKTISGVDYFLDKTDSDVSDTTVDTSSMISDTEDRSFDEISEQEISGPGKEEFQSRIDELQQQIEVLETESFERLSTIREREKDVSRLQKELRERDETIEKILKEKDELLKLSKGRGSSDAVEKASQINELQKEVERLKKEGRSKNDNSVNPEELVVLRVRIETLTRENEEKSKEITRLNKLTKEKEKEKEKETKSEPPRNGKEKEKEKEKEKNGRKIDDSDDLFGDSGEIRNVKAGRDNSNMKDIEEMRRQINSIKQELEEKNLIEKNIYLSDPQFKSNISSSGAAIYDALVAWGTLKDKNGGRVLTNISSSFEVVFKRSANDNSMLCYWLSTISHILVKIKKKTDVDNGANDAKEDPNSPIVRFQSSMVSAIFKVYSRILKNIQTQLSSILAPVILYRTLPPPNPVSSNNPQSTSPENSILGAWVSMPTVLYILNEIHRIMQSSHVNSVIITQFFAQIFYWTSAHLFNTLCSRRELCTVSNGFQIRLQVSLLEEWAVKSDLSSTRDQLAHIIQAAKILVMDKKLLADPVVLFEACPQLNPAQIKRLLELFSPDRLSSDTIPSSVLRTVDEMIEKVKEKEGEEGLVLDLDANYMLRLSLPFLGGKEVEENGEGKVEKKDKTEKDSSSSSRLSSKVNSNWVEGSSSASPAERKRRDVPKIQRTSRKVNIQDD